MPDCLEAILQPLRLGRLETQDFCEVLRACISMRLQAVVVCELITVHRVNNGGGKKKAHRNDFASAKSGVDLTREWRTTPSLDSTKHLLQH